MNEFPVDRFYRDAKILKKGHGPRALDPHFWATCQQSSTTCPRAWHPRWTTLVCLVELAHPPSRLGGWVRGPATAGPLLYHPAGLWIFRPAVSMTGDGS